ncbi:MAG: citrate/2-methylcitrate synthase [Candidatus Heimdallarchaeota archaeon]|nr:citrate/2-methylcitrate synthase [Candidatus Heimdallarchaeota archaeon]
MSNFKKGLEGIIALESEISYIDGEKGILEYRGYKIEELAKLSYDTVVHLLLYGNIPNIEDLDKFSNLIKERRDLDVRTKEVIHFYNFNIEAMDALMTAISHMSHSDPDLNDNSNEANIRKAIRLIAKLPTIVAYFQRIHDGKEIIEPNELLPHCSNFLYMLRGEVPSVLESKILDVDFILSAEHELNASTFAVRVTASTLSDIHSAIISGIGTLKGVLHGGARLAVMGMLDEIGSVENTEKYIMDLIKNKKRIMGFGHRVYKVVDPRANIFRDLAKRLAEEKKDMKWYEMATKIEETVTKELVEKQGKTIFVNVDFYSGVMYKYLNIPPKLATAIFALGRVTGWIAHALEQYGDNRLIRPRAKYVGEHHDHIDLISKVHEE